MKANSIQIKTINGEVYTVQVVNNRSDIVLTKSGVSEMIASNTNLYNVISELIAATSPTVNGVQVDMSLDKNFFVSATKTHYKALLGEEFSPNKSLQELQVQHMSAVAMDAYNTVNNTAKDKTCKNYELSKRFAGGK